MCQNASSWSSLTLWQDIEEKSVVSRIDQQQGQKEYCNRTTTTTTTAATTTTTTTTPPPPPAAAAANYYYCYLY